MPRTTELRYIGPGRCMAMLEWPGDAEPVATVLTIDTNSLGITVVNAEPEFIMRCRGSAEEVRQIYNFVARFVRQAEGGTSD